MHKASPRKHSQILQENDSDVWIYSYADLVTNLLVFFLMYIAIHISPQFKDKIEESFRNMIDQAGGHITERELAQMITEELDNMDLTRVAQVYRDHDGISLTFSGGFFFDTLSADLKPTATAILNRITPILKKVPPKYRIDISGHADSRPINYGDVYPSNWELSAARAARVVRFFSANKVDSKKLRVIAYGDTVPVSNYLRQNRRVTIKIGKGLPE